MIKNLSIDICPIAPGEFEAVLWVYQQCEDFLADSNNAYYLFLFAICGLGFLVNMVLGIAAAIYAAKRGSTLWVIVSIFSILTLWSILIAPIVFIVLKPKWYEAVPKKLAIKPNGEPLSRKEYLLLNLKHEDSTRRIEAIQQLTT